MVSLILSIFRFFIGICGFAFAFVIITNSEKKSTSRYFGLSEFFLGIWMTLAGFQEAYKWYYLDKPIVLTCLLGAEYISAELAVVSVFYFVYNFGKISTYRRSIANYSLYAVPVVNLLIYLVDHFIFGQSPFFDSKASIDMDTIIGGFIFNKKILYYVHNYYCYILLGIIILLFLYKAITNFREYKKIMLFFACGVLIFMIPSMNWFIMENFFFVSHENASHFIDSFSTLFMMTASFFVFVYDEREQSVTLCKNQVFNHSNTPIFIFDGDDKLIETNMAAANLLSNYHIFANKFDPFDTVFPLDKVQQLGIPNLDDENNSSYFSFTSDKKLFYAKKVPVLTTNKKINSYYLVFSRMDFYAESVRHLEQTAFIDSVSGFKKKTPLVQQIFNDISMHSRAICLISLCLNKYEFLLEQNGFLGTNKIIADFSAKLKATIPETDSIFRISDSTFAFILPVTMSNQLPELFHSIKKACLGFSKKDDLSISIGYTVSTNKDVDDIDGFIEKSYQNMLLDKKNPN